MASSTNCFKKEEFRWTKSTDRACKKIKEKLTTTLVLYLLDFSKAFKVACDALGVRIGGC